MLSLIPTICIIIFYYENITFFYLSMSSFNYLIKNIIQITKRIQNYIYPLKIISFPPFSKTFVLKCHEYTSSKRNIILRLKFILLLAFHSKNEISANTIDWLIANDVLLRHLTSSWAQIVFYKWERERRNAEDSIVICSW